jgi:hypothetical protein
MDKKGESISMSVIIIAAIALLVLVILAVLVLRSGNSIFKGTSCTAIAGTCAASCEDLTDGIYSVDQGSSGTAGGCTVDQVCCKKVANVAAE